MTKRIERDDSTPSATPEVGDGGRSSPPAALVDVTALESALGFERFVAKCLHRLFGLAPEEVPAGALSTLEGAMSLMGVDRAYVFTPSDDGGRHRVAYACVADGVDADPTIAEYGIEDYFPWLERKMTRHQDIVISTLDDLGPAGAGERRYCETRGIQSFLMCPMVTRAEIVGMVGIDAIHEPRTWTEEDLRRLRIVGELIGMVLVRGRADQEIQALRERLEKENQELRRRAAKADPSPRIIGNSAAMERVLEAVAQVAPTKSSVLVLGETGTGKELVARAIHRLSPRGDQPLITVNCAALAPTLIESELFGREKGAYTGALTRHAGRFELAHGSTLFLDEIGELPLELQSKLLRALQTGTFERLGGGRTIEVDVRIVAATNLDLRKAVRDGAFREDLYFRLSVFPIEIPPLRERPEDVPALVWSFVRELESQMGRSIEQIPDECLARLSAHVWPGNIRELRNAVERALILARGPVLEIEPVEPVVDDERVSGANLTLAELEARHIRSTLEHCRWRVRGAGGAAQRLGLKPTTLESRMKRLGIARES